MSTKDRDLMDELYKEHAPMVLRSIYFMHGELCDLEFGNIHIILKEENKENRFFVIEAGGKVVFDSEECVIEVGEWIKELSSHSLEFIKWEVGDRVSWLKELRSYDNEC